MRDNTCNFCQNPMLIREQQKKLSALEMELAAARQEGFVSKHLSDTDINKTPKRRPLVVIGILTGFDRKSNRDAIRKAWMGNGIWSLFIRTYLPFIFLCSGVSMNNLLY